MYEYWNLTTSIRGITHQNSVLKHHIRSDIPQGAFKKMFHGAGSKWRRSLSLIIRYSQGKQLSCSHFFFWLQWFTKHPNIMQELGNCSRPEATADPGSCLCNHCCKKRRRVMHAHTFTESPCCLSIYTSKYGLLPTSRRNIFIFVIHPLLRGRQTSLCLLPPPLSSHSLFPSLWVYVLPIDLRPSRPQCQSSPRPSL